jgi:hypothetical protein
LTRLVVVSYAVRRGRERGLEVGTDLRTVGIILSGIDGKPVQFLDSCGR